jgi:hypothetical protein
MATHYEKYGKAYYEKNKAKVIENTRRNKAKWREQWWEYKSTLSCTVCGENHPAALDFHHPKKEDKEDHVYSFINQGRYGKAREEAAKCIVLCANCHRKHHWDERQKKSPHEGG